MNPPKRVSPHSAWARRVMGWALGGALATGLVALVTDSAFMLLGGASLRSSLGASVTSAALGAFIALAASPGLLVVVLVSERLRRARSALRLFWPAPFVLSALAAGLLVTDAIYRPRARAYETISVLFAVATLAIVIANRQTSRVWRNLILLVIGGAAFVLDVATPRPLYRELHDLLSLITIACVLTGMVGVRRRIAAASLPTLMAAVTVLIGAAIVETRTVDNWAPGWRPLAGKLACYEPRLARACRALVDFDGDGFSPVAWGGDCDDFDPDRNPAHHESRRFKDSNCNGVVPPAHPTDSDRGLAPPAGDPDLASNDIDLVLLVTIDCFRYDAFRPDIMPHLWELARHGLVFTRLYTGGSRTKLSLPLVMRGSDDAPPLPERLAAAGIRAMALFGFSDSTLNHQVLAGFKEFYVPAHARWNARELTNLSLAKIHSTAGERRFLWVHYFDAHYPYYPPAEFSPREVPPGMPDSFGPYLSNLSYIDSELARLLERLRQDDILKRTLLIITTDHGEGFGQHGVPLHGVSAYDMLVHVLGVIIGPGIASGHYDQLVSHRDIPATVMGGFGLVQKQPDVELFGRSWLRLRRSLGVELHKFVVTRSARAASGYDYSLPMAAIVQGKLKLIETFEDHLTEMYNPVDDPEERENLLTKMPKEAAELDDNLQMYRDVDGFP